MRSICSPIAAACLCLAACQSLAHSRPTVVADGRAKEVGGGRTPAAVLGSSGIRLGAGDWLVNNGIPVAVDEPLPLGAAIHLQVVRSIPVLINGSPVLTSASTVGEAIRSQDIELYAADLLDPPADSFVKPGMLISYSPSAALQALADGNSRLGRSTSPSVGAALVDAGIPIQGLDVAVPFEEQALPPGKEAQITRVTESLLLVQEPIPFESKTADSADLEVGLEQVVQPGSFGLSVESIRVRREDGLEVSRQAGAPSVVLEPRDRVVVRGTRLVEKTDTIDGVSITYWRNMQMYATVYSPCNSGTADGSCSTGTASGRPAGKGVVAVDPGLYAYLNGQRLFIPGYGFAVVGDIGGGYIIEQNLGISRYKWIDLGFDDNNIEDMTGWISVYFLAPAPPSIPDVLR